MKISILESWTKIHSRHPRWVEGLCVTLLLGLLAAGCIARNVNHDEEQFVASGTLLTRAGLLPYLHYPYFHLPNLVFVFAGLFSTNNFLLLTARSFNVFCAWLLLVLFYAQMRTTFRSLGEKSWPISAAITFLFALNPLFRFTAGRAWNHDLPMLAAAAAFASLLPALHSEASGKWVFASGVLLGVALGTRLTFLPLVVPFVALTWIFHSVAGARSRRTLILLVGMTLALLPTFVLLAIDPKAFLFDNFTANGLLNLRFRQAAKPENVLIAKLFFPFRLILRSPSNLFLLVAFALFACWLPLRDGWRAVRRSSEISAFLLIVPFAILGALLPTPSYRQYYYLPVPFLFLGTAFGLARFCNTVARQKGLVRFLSITLLAGLVELLPDLSGSGILTRPSRWAVWTVHQTGLEIQRRVGAGPVLTLAPIFPLEGGVRIYPQFCTGPFAWRVSAFADERDRARYGLVSAHELDSYLALKPAAILTGVEKRALEAPLIDFARQHQYQKTLLPGRVVLWMRPAGGLP